MNQPTQLHAAEIEMLKEAYASLSRNDIEGFCKIFHPQIERVEFEGSPDGGSYSGIESVTAHVIAGRSTWAEGSCEPERFVVMGDKIIAITHVLVRLKDHSDWIDGQVADVFKFRDGKATHFHSFFTEQQALEWARHDPAVTN